MTADQQKAMRARGLARQATETRIRLEKQLEQARQDERVKSNEALLIEGHLLGILG